MAKPEKLWIAAMTVTIILISYPQALTASGGETMAGLLTSRLTVKQMKTWKSIEEIVFAEDDAGRMIHPKLYRLWHDLETSGHAVYIELSDRRSSAGPVGWCDIEKLDPMGQKHTLVIRLDLCMIDQAVVGEAARRADGFIPLQGLNKIERYAEVLGHELAHAITLLRDSDYLALFLRFKAEAREYLRNHGAMPVGQASDQDRRSDIRSKLEKPAEAAEVEIWQELTAGQAGRIKAPVRTR
jgi:hypothetical protein